MLAKVRDLVAALPEVSEGERFGSPAFRAGKKTFLTVHRPAGRCNLSVWVGGEMQVRLTFDPRFRIPKFTGHNGWIVLDVEDALDVEEVRELVVASYRHFALKRMWKALEGQG